MISNSAEAVQHAAPAGMQRMGQRLLLRAMPWGGIARSSSRGAPACAGPSNSRSMPMAVACTSVLQSPSPRVIASLPWHAHSTLCAPLPGALMPFVQCQHAQRPHTACYSLSSSSSSSSSNNSNNGHSTPAPRSLSAQAQPDSTVSLTTAAAAGTSSDSLSSSLSDDGSAPAAANGQGRRHEEDGPVAQAYLSGAPMQPFGYGSAPPPQPGDLPLWAHEPLPSPVPTHRRIYCNRALNMNQIKAIGWDMDYTLAQYKPESFEKLAHQQTIDKLVNVFGYPDILRSFTFTWDYMMKGLILDKERGNVLKVDRHKYVKLAYHGFVPLSPDARKAAYNTNYQGLNFDSDEFALVDTLFSLAEAYLYCQLVELKDSEHGASLAHKSYKQLYKDLRTAVDMCHRDGSLKKAVAANPEKYIHKDPLLAHMLEQARAGGRRLFLATNSLWDYTNVVMNYLLTGKTGAAKTTAWLQYFDVVMVGCGKPGFFSSTGQLFHVDVKSGLLSNTDNGAPILPVDEADMADVPGGGAQLPPHRSPGTGGEGAQLAQVYQGGCYRDLHRMLGITSGDQVLYVGDHIYGDIVKAKKEIGWRTMLVVPELQLELQLQEETKAIQAELRMLRQERDTLEDQIQRYEWALAHGTLPPPGTTGHAKNLEVLGELRAAHARLKARHSQELEALHRRYHPIWGQILKTGYQNSRFAHQIERFACLYTSHVSNLSYVSPHKKWQGRLDFMAHEDVCLGDGL